MSEFTLWTVLIACLALGAFLWALLVERDVFHPATFLGPMIAFLYVYLPWELHRDGLLPASVYSVQELASVQIFNAACVAALLLGCVLASGKRGALRRGVSAAGAPVNVGMGDRAFMAGLVFGGLGVAAYAVNLGNVGGVVGAYSVEKGGGTAESGYVRDAVMWCLTALGFVYLRMMHGRVGWPQYAAILCFAGPLAMHALLSGRRGPTFVIFSLLFFGWYLARRKRPGVLVFLGGGLSLAMLMLVMLTFRESFRLGSNLFAHPSRAIEEIATQFKEKRGEQMERSVSGNEFIYGVTVVREFQRTKDFFWGKRLAAILFIRPIPRQLWPTKYEDCGLGRLEVNAGLSMGDDNTGGVAFGAAPGFAADMFAEFSWGAIGFSFLVGWAYGAAWRRCVSIGGIWLVIYLLMVAFSVFFAVQTLEAILFRMAFTAIPAAFVWHYYISPRVHRAVARRRPVVTARPSTSSPN